EFDGHSPDSDGAVEFLVVLAHALNQRFVGVSAGGAGVASGPPSVEARPVRAEYRAQPLHPVGGGVVAGELEAAHQVVSPAKYLAALRRMSRSVVSFAVSAFRRWTSDRRRTSSSSGSSPWSALAGDVEGICPRSRRALWTQVFSVPRAIPRSSEIEEYEAPSVVS